MGKTLGGGELYAGGARRFLKEGQPVPKGVRFPNKGFDDKLHELRFNQAPELVKNYKFGKAVAELLKSHNGNPKEMTEEVCRQFLLQYFEFTTYHPALVRAVAEDIAKDNLAKEAPEITH